MNQGLLSDSTRDIVALLSLALGLTQTISTLVTIWLSVGANDHSLEAQEERTNRNLGPVILKSLKSTGTDIREFGRTALVIAVSTFLLSLIFSYLPDWVNRWTVPILVIAILVQDAFLVAVIMDFNESVMYELDSKAQRFLWICLLVGIWLTILSLSVYSWGAYTSGENWFNRVLGAQGLIAMFFLGVVLLATTVVALDRIFKQHKQRSDH